MPVFNTTPLDRREAEAHTLNAFTSESSYEGSGNLNIHC